MPNLVTYRKKSVETPSSWNEMSKNEFLYYCKLYNKFFHTDSDQIDPNKFYAGKILMVRKLIKMKWRHFRRLNRLQLADLLPLMDFVNETPNLDKQHLPVVRVGFRKFYGPQPGMPHSSFAEFIFTDRFFGRYAETGDEKYLYKLIACLYRPKNDDAQKHSDIREEFNDASIDARAKYFKRRMKASTKWAIFFFYWGFRNCHVTTHKSIYPDPPKDEQGKTRPKKKRRGVQLGWTGTALELAGEKFGDFENTLSTNWLTIFIEIVRRLEIAADRDRRAAKNKKK